MTKKILKKLEKEIETLCDKFKIRYCDISDRYFLETELGNTVARNTDPEKIFNVIVAIKECEE